LDLAIFLLPLALREIGSSQNEDPISQSKRAKEVSSLLTCKAEKNITGKAEAYLRALNRALVLEFAGVFDEYG